MSPSTSTDPRVGSSAVLLPGFDGLELPGWLADRLERGLAGVCLFGQNIESPHQVRRLTDAIRAHNPHALIAVDEEGGDVTRLYYDRGAPTPGSAWLGRYDDLAATEQAGAAIARELREVGINLNFAPSADINSNDANPVIGVRSFGADPRLVAAHAAAWVRGHQAEGVAACAKHFPGHGDTDLDSHLALPTVTAPLSTLRTRELLPFRAVIEEDVWSVMTSHIVLTQMDEHEPATFSSVILRELLRDELRFDGVVVSDALDMAGASGRIGIPNAAVRAVVGGCDLLCIGTDNTADQLDEIEVAIDTAAADDELVQAALCVATRRVRALSEKVAPPSSVLPGLGDAFGATKGPDGVDVRSGFAINDHAAAMLAAGSSRWTAIVVANRPNSAAGTAPWGIEAAAPAGAIEVVRVDRSSAADAWSRLQRDVPVVLVGRDNHRHPWVRELIADLRNRRPDVLVVEMGWPESSHSYADVATYGASRRMGEGLVRLLTGRDDDEVDR